MLIGVMLAAALGGTAAAPPAAKPPIDTSKSEIRVPASSVAGVVAQGANDEIICRKEQLLGSRVFKTVCEQKSVAEERRRLEQDAVRHIQDVSKMGHP